MRIEPLIISDYTFYLQKREKKRGCKAMSSETFIDFVFVRDKKGNFTTEIDQSLRTLFKQSRLNWYLEEKVEGEAEIIVAEIKGMSTWQREEEIIDFLESHGTDRFWNYLCGYQIYVYPAKKGCKCCETTSYR